MFSLRSQGSHQFSLYHAKFDMTSLFPLFVVFFLFIPCGPVARDVIILTQKKVDADLFTIGFCCIRIMLSEKSPCDFHKVAACHLA